MANHRALPRSEWNTFFNALSGALQGSRAEVEVASLALGDQIVAEWMPLSGITYDRENNVLDVALVGLRHLIQDPKDILVQEGPTGVTSIAVAARDGSKQIVTLKTPLMLPPASV